MTNYVNEPIDSQRVVTVLMANASGVGQPGLAASLVVKIAKGATGNMVALVAPTIDEVTGGVDGLYTIQFAIGDWDTEGAFTYQVTDPGLVARDFISRIVLEPRRGCLHYGKAVGATSSTIKLATTAVAQDDYYAGAGASCVVAIVKGTGVGQARLATDYAATNFVLSVSPNWGVTPDNTSIYELIPYTGQLDAAVTTALITSIWSALLSANHAAGSMGEALLVALTAAGINVIRDTVTDGATPGVVTAVRTRGFGLDNAAAAAAVAGHANGADGELVRMLFTLIEGGTAGTWTSLKGVRTL